MEAEWERNNKEFHISFETVSCANGFSFRVLRMHESFNVIEGIDMHHILCFLLLLVLKMDNQVLNY